VIFQAGLQWAAAECKRRGLEVNSTNCRTVLGDALFLIRLPTMALEDFANDAAQSGILTLQETTDVFLFFTARNKPNLLYNCKSRAGLKPQVCLSLLLIVLFPTNYQIKCFGFRFATGFSRLPIEATSGATAVVAIRFNSVLISASS